MGNKKKETMFGKAGGFIKNMLGDDIPDYLKNPSENQQNQPIIQHMTEITIAPATTTETDSKYEDQILKAVRNADLPGPDFLELSEAVKKLRELNSNLSLEDCLKNAFAILSSTGLTKDQAIKTGDHYLEVLLKEEERFGNSILNALQAKVNTPLSEIEDFKKQKTELQNQLVEIQQKIENYNQQIELKTKDVEIAKEKLSLNKAKFKNTLNKVKAEMIELVNLIKKTNL